MKTKIVLLIIVFSTTFWGCAQNQTTKDDSALKMLKEFYVNYLESFDDTINFSNDKDIVKKFCSQNFIDWYEKMPPGLLGHDPFLNAQDSRDEWSETLTITKNNYVKNVYDVTLYDPYFKQKTTIKLLLIKEEKGFKIDSILNPYGEDWISY